MLLTCNVHHPAPAPQLSLGHTQQLLYPPPPPVESLLNLHCIGQLHSRKHLWLQRLKKGHPPPPPEDTLLNLHVIFQRQNQKHPRLQRLKKVLHLRPLKVVFLVAYLRLVLGAEHWLLSSLFLYCTRWSLGDGTLSQSGNKIAFPLQLLSTRVCLLETQPTTLSRRMILPMSIVFLRPLTLTILNNMKIFDVNITNTLRMKKTVIWFRYNRPQSPFMYRY